MYFIRQLKNWFDLILVIQSGISLLLERWYYLTKSNWTPAEANALIFFYTLSVLRLVRILYLAKNFDTMKVLVFPVISCLDGRYNYAYIPT